MTVPPDYPGAPRWVKALGILALIALLAVIAMHLTGGGLAHVIDHATGHSASAP